jgi:hypothetical protein
MYFKFLLLLLFEVASCGGFSTFVPALQDVPLDTKVEKPYFFLIKIAVYGKYFLLLVVGTALCRPSFTNIALPNSFRYMPNGFVPATSAW